MLILSRVCAEFRDIHGRVLLTIRPEDLLSFIEAPEEIRGDPLFTLMLSDGTLEAVRSVQQQRQLEKDPLEGTAADGRKISPAPDPVEAADDPAGAAGGSHPASVDPYGSTSDAGSSSSAGGSIPSGSSGSASGSNSSGGSDADGVFIPSGSSGAAGGSAAAGRSGDAGSAGSAGGSNSSGGSAAAGRSGKSGSRKGSK